MVTILDQIFAWPAGVRIYGLGAIALGLVGLVWGDFAVVWQPGPGVPQRTALAYAVAVAPLLAGMAMQRQRFAGSGAVVLAVLYALAVILFDIPRALAQPSVFVNWYGIAEHLAPAAAGLIAYAFCGQLEPTAGGRQFKIGRLIFGACLIVFGLSHLVYLAYTAKLVPAWLPPGQNFWVYFTAAGFFAAGIANLSGFCAWIAGRWLTLMLVVFGILVHAPTLFIAPHAHGNWAENALNLAMIGCAWVSAAPVPSPKIKT